MKTIISVSAGFNKKAAAEHAKKLQAKERAAARKRSAMRTVDGIEKEIVKLKAQIEKLKERQKSIRAKENGIPHFKPGMR